LSHSASPFFGWVFFKPCFVLCFFELGSQELLSQDWFWTVILLIFATSVARLTGTWLQSHFLTIFSPKDWSLGPQVPNPSSLPCCTCPLQAHCWQSRARRGNCPHRAQVLRTLTVPPFLPHFLPVSRCSLSLLLRTTHSARFPFNNFRYWHKTAETQVQLWTQPRIAVAFPVTVPRTLHSVKAGATYIPESVSLIFH
jgi:hypothetical protein